MGKRRSGEIDSYAAGIMSPRDEEPTLGGSKRIVGIFEPDEDSGLVGLVAFEFKMRCMGSGIEEGWELLDLRTPAAAFWNINSFIHDRSPVFDERGNFVWRSV